MFTAKKEEPPPRAIGLITDFGLSDPYVGQMKAALARKAPKCTLLDVTHGVEPFNVAQGAFFLAASYPHFSEDAVILAVVDPGVGTERRIVCLTVDQRIILGPDNGLLSLVPLTAGNARVRAFDMSTAVTAPKNVAPTFHGRDVFAPIAAWLALGGAPDGLGREIALTDLADAPWSRPDVDADSARCNVLHIDQFGNCVLNLEAETVPHGAATAMTSPAKAKLTRAGVYAELSIGSPGLLDGSQGFMEIAVNQGSAAVDFGLSMGDSVELTW